VKDTKNQPGKQEQKDHQQQQKHHQQKQQQQKTKQAPKKAQELEVFHEHERIETRMTR
jgi:hypothetical protein